MHIPRSSCVLQHAQAIEVTLERGTVSHARAKIERQWSVKNKQQVLFQILQSARAKEVTL